MSTDAKKLFRTVLSRFATGVTVVSFERGKHTFGMTVNSFSSVSLDPPLVLFCPSLDCRFSQGAEKGSPFTISILAEAQASVCAHFAGQAQLESTPWIKIPVPNTHLSSTRLSPIFVAISRPSTITAIITSPWAESSSTIYLVRACP